MKDFITKMEYVKMNTDSVSPPQVLAVSHGGFELIDMQANGSRVKMITHKNMKKMNQPTNQPTKLGH